MFEILKFIAVGYVILLVIDDIIDDLIDIFIK